MSAWQSRAVPTTLAPPVRPVTAGASWDRWKAPGADGVAALALRERCMWQSVLGLARPPELTDLRELARACRG